MNHEHCVASGERPRPTISLSWTIQEQCSYLLSDNKLTWDRYMKPHQDQVHWRCLIVPPRCICTNELPRNPPNLNYLVRSAHLLCSLSKLPPLCSLRHRATAAATYGLLQRGGPGAVRPPSYPRRSCLPACPAAGSKGSRRASALPRGGSSSGRSISFISQNPSWPTYTCILEYTAHLIVVRIPCTAPRSHRDIAQRRRSALHLSVGN